MRGTYKPAEADRIERQIRQSKKITQADIERLTDRRPSEPTMEPSELACAYCPHGGCCKTRYQEAA